MSTKKTVWVHVGLAKCGSTTIQCHFAANDAAYAAQGLCYPETGREPAGYRSHRPLVGATQNIGPLLDDLQAEAAGCDHILVSNEELSAPLPRGNGPAFVNALNDRFGSENVRILAYFRNAYDFVESAYAQFVKAGLFHISPDQFFGSASPDLDRFLDMFAAKKGFPLYSLMGHAAQIIAAFPRNHVQFRSLERMDMDGRDLVGDLCALVSVRPVAEPVRQNRRDPELLTVVQHHAQTIAARDAFLRARPQLARFVRDRSQADRAATFRSSALRIGPDLHARIKPMIEAETANLARFFSTGVDGLVQDRWTPDGGSDTLTAAEKAAIGDILAAV